MASESLRGSLTGKMPKMKLLSRITEAYHTTRENAKLPIMDIRLKHKCPECLSVDTAIDDAQGAVICTNCGREVDRVRKDHVFGAGATQFSLESSKDSFLLDAILKDRAVGATTKVYKDRLLRKASREIRGIAGFNDELVELACDMFKTYSDSMEKVQNFKSVVEASIVCAKKELSRREGPASNLSNGVAPSFPCSKCGVDFACLRDRRLHRCKARHQILHQMKLQEKKSVSSTEGKENMCIFLGTEPIPLERTKNNNPVDTVTKMASRNLSGAWSVKTESDSPTPDFSSDSRPGTPNKQIEAVVLAVGSKKSNSEPSVAPSTVEKKETIAQTAVDVVPAIVASSNKPAEPLCSTCPKNTAEPNSPSETNQPVQMLDTSHKTLSEPEVSVSQIDNAALEAEAERKESLKRRIGALKSATSGPKRKQRRNRT